MLALIQITEYKEIERERANLSTSATADSREPVLLNWSTNSCQVAFINRSFSLDCTTDRFKKKTPMARYNTTYQEAFHRLIRSKRDSDSDENHDYEFTPRILLISRQRRNLNCYRNATPQPTISPSFVGLFMRHQCLVDITCTARNMILEGGAREAALECQDR